MENEFIIFDESEKVKIALIDQQHKEMSFILNDIYKHAISGNNSKLIVELQKLIDLLRVHFIYEEGLMKETKFEGYYSHKMEHDRFFKKVETLKDNLKKQDVLISVDELNNLKNWFHNHIEISDKKCGAHFVAMGIK